MFFASAVVQNGVIAISALLTSSSCLPTLLRSGVYPSGKLASK